MCFIIVFRLCGSPPFISDDEDSLMAQIRQGEFDFFSPDWDDISSEGKEFQI